jgi:hypothetical protein
MKVLELYEEESLIQNATEFKSKFTAPEWANLICWMLETYYLKGREVSDSESSLLFRELQNSIGVNMQPATTPAQWASAALTRKVTMGGGNPTWNSIYKFLEPHKGHTCSITVSNAGNGAAQGTRAPVLSAQTPETREEIAALMSNTSYPATLTTVEQVQNYMRDFLSAVAATESRSTRDRQGRKWGDYINAHNDLRITYTMIFNELVEGESLKEPVPRTTMDRELYSWLVTADDMIYRYRSRPSN